MLAVADDAPARPKCELAHVFREYGEDNRRTHRLPPSHHRVMRAIEHCRTSALGGHMEQCNLCGFEHPAYDVQKPPLSQVPMPDQGPLAGEAKSQAPSRRAVHLVYTLNHELNPPHPGKQKSLVSSFVSIRLRDSLSLRSHSPSGNPRLYLSPPYLEPTTPRPPPLPHPPRSSVFRSNSSNSHPQKLPPPCRTPQHRLPAIRGSQWNEGVMWIGKRESSSFILISVGHKR